MEQLTKYFRVKSSNKSAIIMIEINVNSFFIAYLYPHFRQYNRNNPFYNLKNKNNISFTNATLT